MCLLVLAMNLKISSEENYGYFVQQPLAPAVAEQNGVETAWFGPALSHTLDAQSFPGAMLLAALRASSLAQMHLLSISGTAFKLRVIVEV